MNRSSKDTYAYIKIVIAILFSIAAVFSLNPFFGWEFEYFVVAAPVLAIIAFVFALSIKKIVLSEANLLTFTFALIIAVYLNLSDLRTIAVNLVFYIPILTFIFLSTDLKKIVVHYFILIFSLTLLPAIIIFLFNGLGIDFSWKYLKPLNSLKAASGMYYKQYFGAVVLTNTQSSLGFPYRISAIYDEPGVVGTLAALILTAKGFNLKESKTLKIIFIGGVLSFSLFFYIVIIVYLLLSSLLEFKFRRLFIFIIVIVIYNLFSQGVFYNEFINDRIISRLQIENRSLVGNNRTGTEFDTFFNSFLNSGVKNKIFGLGRNFTATQDDLYSAASWKKLVIERGFLSLFLIILFYLKDIFFRTLNKRNRKNILIYFIVLLLCIYQRPGVFDLPFYIIFLSSFNLSEKIQLKSGGKRVGK